MNDRQQQTDGFQASEAVRALPLAQLDPSPLDPEPGRHEDPGQSMVDSVRENGVLQPIIVRAKGGRFEIIFGHRRFGAALKAAGDAKSATIPAIVRAWEDAEVLAAQLQENEQREDPSPLAQAKGYATLAHEHGLSPEQIAERVGQSTATVYKRLALARLVPEGVKRFAAGDLGVGGALRIARCGDPQLQREALKRVFAHHYKGDGPVSVAYIDRALEDLTREVAKAPFDTTDATLLKRAPACGACPKNTAQQGALFDAKGEGGRCLDVNCWGAKTKAHGERLIAQVRERGGEILEGDAAKRALKEVQHGQRGKNWTDVEAECYEAWTPRSGRERSHAQVLGRRLVDAHVVVAVEPKTGQLRRLVATPTVEAELKRKKILRRTAPAAGTGSSRSTGSARTSIEKRRRYRLHEAGALADAVAAKVQRARTGAFGSVPVLQVLVVGLIDEVWADIAKGIVQRRGWLQKKRKGHRVPNDYKDQVRRYARASERTAAELLGLGAELLLGRGLDGTGRGARAKTIGEAFGIDTAAVARDLRARVRRLERARGKKKASKKKAVRKKRARKAATPRVRKVAGGGPRSKRKKKAARRRTR